MIFWIIFSGLLVGFTSGVPFGPVGAYCIKKSLADSNYGGYFVGLGASVADALFALVASFGITIISSFLIEHEASIQSIGGIFLIVVGLKEFSTRFSFSNGIDSGKKDFFSGLSIALASPFVIFSFLALYAILGLGIIAGNYSLSLLLAVSTFAGSIISITFLNWMVIKYKRKIRQSVIDIVNKIIGGIIFFTGAYLLARGIFLS